MAIGEARGVGELGSRQRLERHCALTPKHHAGSSLESSAAHGNVRFRRARAVDARAAQRRLTYYHGGIASSVVTYELKLPSLAAEMDTAPSSAG